MIMYMCAIEGCHARNVGDPTTEELKRLLRQIEEIDPQEKQALPAVPGVNVQPHAGLQSPGKQTELWGALGVAILIVVAAGVGAILALKLPAISIVVVRDGASDTKFTTAPSAARNATNPEPAPRSRPLLIGALQRTPLQPDQAWPLGLRIAPEATGGTLVVKGLVAGAKLSVGRPSDTNGWELKADEIDGAVIIPPPGFAGSMELSVELQLAEGLVAERQSVQLEWARPAEPKPAIAQTRGVDAPGFAVRKLDPDEIAALRRRGEELFADRDVAAARLMLLRAAEAADARAALALAKTYDPIALSDLGVGRAFADPAMARSWYEKAREFGSTEAQHRLDMLARRSE